MVFSDIPGVWRQLHRLDSVNVEGDRALLERLIDAARRLWTCRSRPDVSPKIAGPAGHEDFWKPRPRHDEGVRLIASSSSTLLTDLHEHIYIRPTHRSLRSCSGTGRAAGSSRPI
jgi:hypothetical protein